MYHGIIYHSTRGIDWTFVYSTRFNGQISDLLHQSEDWVDTINLALYQGQNLHHAITCHHNPGGFIFSLTPLLGSTLEYKRGWFIYTWQCFTVISQMKMISSVDTSTVACFGAPLDFPAISRQNLAVDQVDVSCSEAGLWLRSSKHGIYVWEA